MTTKNTEFLRAITGPKIEYNGSPVTRYSTWSIGGGLKVDENPFFNKLNLSVDDQHIIDLINQHGGGGGGDASLWAEYPATQDVDMDGYKLTGLGEPTDAADAATKAYVDSQSGGGGGPTDRIESPSGKAYVEAVDYSAGSETTMRSEGEDSYAIQRTETRLHEAFFEMRVGVDGGPPVGIFADTDGSIHNLVAFGAPLYVVAPTANNHAATKGYVDGIAGLAASIADGELPLTTDSANSTNITSSAAGPLRYTRIGRTITLSGLIQLTADSAGAATAAFTGINGAAAPATNNTWRGIITDQANGTPKNLNIMVYGANNGFRYTVVGAEAGASYRISFVMAYRSAS